MILCIDGGLRNECSRRSKEGQVILILVLASTLEVAASLVITHDTILPFVQNLLACCGVVRKPLGFQDYSTTPNQPIVAACPEPACILLGSSVCSKPKAVMVCFTESRVTVHLSDTHVSVQNLVLQFGIQASIHLNPRCVDHDLPFTGSQHMEHIVLSGFV